MDFQAELTQTTNKLSSQSSSCTLPTKRAALPKVLENSRTRIRDLRSFTDSYRELHSQESMHRHVLLLGILLFAVSVLGSGCVAGSPMAIRIPIPASMIGQDEEHMGVVIGLWQLDMKGNRERLSQDSTLSAKEIDNLTPRPQVRVGIQRSLLWGLAAEVVVLPENWKFSTTAVINDGITVNVGDVVLIRGAVGRRVDYLLSILRKCDDAPVPNERWGFDLGCRRVEEFDGTGYGGEYYIFTMF